ncbi:MAG: glycosyltransferase family 9 protein [Pirellulales bacterium]|nr:glycosyltransferase family 9 protein [Pirellulales bacterium]
MIVRLSAVGDVIQAAPIACALREQYPKAFIAWAVAGRTASLLEGHKAIDRIIQLPRDWLKSPRGVWRLRRQLHELRFEIAIEAQGLMKAALLAWLSGAKRRIGFGKPWGRELTPWLNTETVDTPNMHAVERNLALLRPLGIESPNVAFDLPEREEDRQAAERIIQSSFPQFAIINPGAGWPSKLWPTVRFAAVAKYLGESWSLPTLVVWAGEDENRMAEEIAAGSGGNGRVAPNTSLAELASLSRRAKLFIGSDTGPLHLAAAVGTPCVGLYGPWPAKIHGPYGKQHIALQKAFFDGPTHKKRTAPKALMEAIEIGDVCDACEAILKRER